MTDGERRPTTNEQHLDDIGALMVEFGENDFVREVGRGIVDVAANHTAWTGTCPPGADHWDNALPCEEWERALSLALSWLRAQVNRDYMPLGYGGSRQHTTAERVDHLRHIAGHLNVVDPAGYLRGQLNDLADLLVVAEREGWFTKTSATSLPANTSDTKPGGDVA